ncbi:MAG: isoprenylcysteine carboxylmethyltransferase family protein [Candidatus Heimdallarchaeota archaeon]|nr:isoprenylcysteine carboxylmethyltransferase family protein [Candidatus Heimdallarchaeota archaeon]
MTEINRTSLAIKAILNFSLLYIILGACFFLPAMSFDYWQAWLYIGTFGSLMLIYLIYLVLKDPELLLRRMEKGEEREKQRWIIRVADVVILGIFVFPAFDMRNGWSEVPVWLIYLADILFILGYLFFFWVLRTNSYASRLAKVEDTQQVITDGPYSLVRHPMYTSLFIMMLVTPIILGSFFGLLFMFPFVLVLKYRISDEEDMLVDDLPGYDEYKQKVRYKIFPHIW